MISTSLLFKNFSQTITAIYDKASSMTHLLTSAWCKRIQACICAKGRYFEHLGLIQMFVYVFAIRRKSSDFF